MYMSIPFLAQMGDLTGDQKYFDDAARQVIQYADRLMNPATGLFDHSWFAHEPNDPKFYWGAAPGGP
jgi:rhamnogalacturonyl hydrolase YesR